MADYKKSSIVGESWVRAYSININNPYVGVKSIHFQEEKALLTDDGDVLTKRIGEVSSVFDDASEPTEFSLRNPESNEIVGTATYGDVYAILHSLYMHLALKRDEETTRIVEPPPPAPTV